jgi:5-amino-6-(5-phosphoribosylamino)uracil reductase
MARPQLRLVLAVSLDGRLAPASGGAAQLGGRGDRRALEEALAWADGCLIGANTLRLHGSTCLIHDADLLAQRRQQRGPSQPLALVVSRSGRFDPALPFFTQPVQRWLLSPGSWPAIPGNPPAGFSRQLGLETEDWSRALAALGEAGLQRLVVLGGAQLAVGLLQQGCIDQLQLTVCPQLLGGAHTWIPVASLLQGGGDAAQWHLLEHRPLGGDELLLRYGRAPRP